MSEIKYSKFHIIASRKKIDALATKIIAAIYRNSQKIYVTAILIYYLS